MTNRRRWTLLAVVGVVAPLCAGCVTLLPKAAPEPLYRFGGGDASAPSPVPAVGRGQGLLGIVVTLPAASRGDALLAVTGRSAAYISGGRWVSPASDLFREAAARALAAHGAAGPGGGVLTLAVTRFEADYDHGTDDAPTVRIEAALRLSDGVRPPRSLGVVEGEAPAAANRIGAIVSAYDTALDAVLAGAAAALDRDAQSTTRDRPDQRDQAISGLPVSPR